MRSAAFAALAAAGILPLAAQTMPPPPPGPVITAPARPRQAAGSANELVDAGHHFFGGVSRGLATIVEKAGSEWGKPNGTCSARKPAARSRRAALRRRHALHQERGRRARLLAGPVARLRCRRRRRANDDAGLQPAAQEAIFERFGGIDGSAYFVGGLGMTALTAYDIVVVPIRTGRRVSSRRQSRLSRVHAAADLRSV